MTDHEYETCKAEAEYDFQREERMLTDDDHWDNSQWQDFMSINVAFWSTEMIKQARRDLKDELNSRAKPAVPKSDFYTRLQETVAFMEDAKNYDEESF